MRPRMGTFESSTRVAKTIYTLPAASSPSKFPRHWSAPCSRRHPEEAAGIVARTSVSRAAQVASWQHPSATQPSLLRALLECLVGFGAWARLPLKRIVISAVARPWVEGVDHGREFRRQLRHGAQQHPLQRRHLLAMAVVSAFLHLHRAGTVVLRSE